jgi:hypothetical protein
MVKRTSIRPFLFGAAAMLLAYLGQRALRIDSYFDASLLYASAVAIFLAALYALRTTKIDSIWLILVSGAVSILFHLFS